MTFAEKFHAVYAHYGKSYWASRITAQILYAVKLSETEGSRYEREIGHVLDVLLASIEADGVISRIEDVGGPDDVTLHYYARYRTEDGAEVEGLLSNPRSDLAVGQPVRLKYHPKHRTNARLI